MSTPRFFALLLLAGLSTQCSSDIEPDTIPEPTVSFNDASRAVLRDVTPLVAGTWIMERVQVRRKPYHLYPQTFPADTVLQQFATLTLKQLPFTRADDDLYPEFEGTMTYKTTTYPIAFNLRVNPNHVLEKVGPPALLLFEYGPIPLHTTTAEETFLQEIGLMSEHFTLEAVKGESTMTWRGQTRHLEQIVLRKQ